jgi:hypothetical protein
MNIVRNRDQQHIIIIRPVHVIVIVLEPAPLKSVVI